jgi:hypothetical protein
MNTENQKRHENSHEKGKELLGSHEHSSERKKKKKRKHHSSTNEAN